MSTYHISNANTHSQCVHLNQDKLSKYEHTSHFKCGIQTYSSFGIQNLVSFANSNIFEKNKNIGAL